jgi:pimeloyl-ACP methyl ester carboxylesterase
MSNANSNNFLISTRHDDGNGVPGCSLGEKAVYISSTVPVKPVPVDSNAPTCTYNLIHNAAESTAEWLSAIHKEHTQVLVFVHGFGNNAANVVSRHQSVSANVPGEFAVVSFDWPSGNDFSEKFPGQPIKILKENYRVDQQNAGLSAGHLMDCLQVLAAEFGPQNVHLFAHSMGAYVTEKAFHSAPDRFIKPVNHVVFAAADVNQKNYASGAVELNKFLNCCTDLSVYWSKKDEAMIASAVTINTGTHRLGGGPNGGFPGETPASCTSIDSTAYWMTTVRKTHKSTDPSLAEFSHVWYITFQPKNDFFGDIGSVLKSAKAFPTREFPAVKGVFTLIPAPVKNENTI